MDQKKTPTDFEVRFHCSERAHKSARKSKHRILSECETIKQVLYRNPEHGVSIPGNSELRKMRVAVAGMGKRGGYRLIYRKLLVDEILYIVLLDTYFKGDCEDLTHLQYSILKRLSEVVLQSPTLFAWE